MFKKLQMVPEMFKKSLLTFILLLQMVPEMFKKILLTLILLLQIVPSMFDGYFTLELQYEIYQINSLLIITLLSGFIFTEQSVDKPYERVISLLLLIASLWFMCNYILTPTVVEGLGILIRG